MSAPFVVVAMSGGVDSSVAAALLLEAGWRVEGVSLRLWDSPRQDDRVCSDHREAGRAAAALGIPHRTIDERAAFEHDVVAPFVREAASGRTPSPCIACNSRFKLGRLLDWALDRGADAIATGHYARVCRDPQGEVGAPRAHGEGGRNGGEGAGGRGVRLLRGADRERDQSYFLFELGQRELARLRFPVGALDKEAVRRHARRLGLPAAEKSSSQDLCLGTPAELVRSRGAGAGRGEIVAEDGRVLGRHPGVEGYTVGQRRGLGLAAPKPLYVRRIEGAARRLVVGARPPRSGGLVAQRWNWISGAPPREVELVAQVRSRPAGVPATIEAAHGERVRLRFPSGAEAVTPGQAVALYREEELVGGGWIERALEVS